MTLPNDPRPADLESLHEHAHWLRQLARALVGDAASADDLVQDAFGAALTSARPIRNLRAFLSGTVRHRSALLRREAGRRRERERVHGEGWCESVQGADEAAARVEWLGVVLDELRTLPTAQREALTLRFVEGLEPREIARRAGIAPGTVRAHIARGLAALRDRLDRRSGGRHAWVCVAVPFSDGWRTPELAVTPSTVLLTGVAAMSLKAALVALVPLTVLGLWVGLRGTGDASVEPSVRSPEDAIDAEPTLAELTDPGTGPPAPDRMPAERPQARAQSAETSASPGEPRVRGIDAVAVDARTGEPIPGLRVGVARSPSLPEGHVPVAGSRRADPPRTEVDRATQEARIIRTAGGVARPSKSLVHPGAPYLLETDRDGRLVSTDEMEAWLMAQTGVSLFARDGDHPSVRPTLPRLHDVPIRGELAFEVGPTYRLLSSEPPGVPWSSLHARIYDGPEQGSWEFKAAVRGDVRPWVRLPVAVTLLPGEGPWELEVTDEAGLWRGRGVVTCKVGIEPTPVEITFQSFGAVEFAAPFDEGEPAPVGNVELASVAGPGRATTDSEPLVARLVPSRTEQPPRSIGIARALPPGLYRWTHADLSGEVRVFAGEQAQVVIERQPRGGSFDCVVRIDATTLGGLDLSFLTFRVVGTEHLFAGYEQTPTRDEARGPGYWLLRLEGLSAGAWNAHAPSAQGGIEWQPSIVPLRPGFDPQEVVAGPPAKATPVAFRAVDAETAEPIPGAVVALGTGDLMYTTHRASTSGAIRTSAVPVDRPAHAYVNAPGYRVECVRFTPADHGASFEVPLKRGWGTALRIVEPGSVEWISGVEVMVDGSSAGRTDEFGSVWITGDGPPDQVELVDLPSEFEIVLSPFDSPIKSETPPPMGYVMVVGRR